MCTVVYIPRGDHYFIASLRDENPKRPVALPPDIYTVDNSSFLSPKDPLAGGTWVGVSEQGNTIVLLNGGFEKHVRKKYYRKSRGLIVTELLSSPIPIVDWSLIDMEDIEPFTLILLEEGNLFQLVWDGMERHRIRLDSKQPHIWSSSTLYNNTVAERRKELFQNWVAMNPPVSKLSVLNFFKSFTETENGFIMNRNENLKTLSYTFLELESDKRAVMSYFDLVGFTYISREFQLHSPAQNCEIHKG
jgi:hypothetical protein